jgi:hypothetical protein
MELIPKALRERMLANGWRKIEHTVKDEEPGDLSMPACYCLR